MPPGSPCSARRDLAHVTHRELEAAVAQLPADVEPSGSAPTRRPRARPTAFDGLWILPGTPYRDAAAVDAAIGWALASGTPLLGTCGGFQYMVLALAAPGRDRRPRPRGGRPGRGRPRRRAARVQPRRRGAHGHAVPGTRLAALCGTAPFTGFHWCGYGLAEAYVARLEAAGVVVGARAPDAGVEAIELPDHPFFLATLFQPQVGALAGARCTR